MTETWLKPNRRALVFGCIPPMILGAIGLWLLLKDDRANRSLTWWLAAAMVFAGAAALSILVRQIRRPRVAFRDGNVLFNLRPGAPIAVPVNVVEAFFVGQGPAHLPGGIRQNDKTYNLVARLSQRHVEWKQQTVKPALGNWCDSYVTIRGTWCEPLNDDVVRRLNRRLKELKATTSY